MGLIYSKIESDSLIEGLQINIASSKEATQSLNSGSKHLISTVSSGALSGAAYTAGQGLFSDLIVPTIKKVTTAFDDIESDLSNYKSANRVISKESYLDEDQLERQIKIKRASLATCITSIRLLSQMDSPPTGFIQRLREMSMDLTDDIKNINEKLDKLHQFSFQTAGLFSHSLSNLKIAMQSVIILNNTFMRNDGSYVLPEGFDSSWFESLKGMTLVEMKEKIAVDREISGLNLSEEGKTYYRELMKEALKGVDPAVYEKVIKEYSQTLLFDDKGNILGIKATSLVALLTGKLETSGFKILKNGEVDPELTGIAYEEVSDEQWEQLKERLPQVLHGTVETLISLGVLDTDVIGTYTSRGVHALSGISEAVDAGILTGGATGVGILADGLGMWALSSSNIVFRFAQSYNEITRDQLHNSIDNERTL